VTGVTTGGGPGGGPGAANAGQAAGEARARLAAAFDAEIRRHDEHFRAAAAVRPADRVLDVGCGSGKSTRDAARAATAGSALGVDISEPLLAVARRLTAAEGPPNADYLQADAQTHRFPVTAFDLCISRFGTMFFADPVAAFTNLGHALRPGARLVLLVWQHAERNEWSTAVHEALAPGTSPPARPDGGQHAFSLADPDTTRRILTAAGFTGIDLAEVDEPVHYGPGVDAAQELVLGLRDTRDLLAELSEAQVAAAHRRLRDTLEAHATADGVHFGSRAWIVTARRG